MEKHATEEIVLFAICMQNYHNFPGVRLNTPDLSSHPQEKEAILIEGVPMFVLGVEQKMVPLAGTSSLQEYGNSESLLQDDYFWNQYRGKKVTIIHLLNAYQP